MVNIRNSFGSDNCDNRCFYISINEQKQQTSCVWWQNIVVHVQNLDQAHTYCFFFFFFPKTVISSSKNASFLRVSVVFGQLVILKQEFRPTGQDLWRFLNASFSAGFSVIRAGIWGLS